MSRLITTIIYGIVSCFDKLNKWRIRNMKPDITANTFRYIGIPAGCFMPPITAKARIKPCPTDMCFGSFIVDGDFYVDELVNVN